MNFRKFILTNFIDSTSYNNFFCVLEEARAKALAIVQENKTISQVIKLKTVFVEVTRNLPKIQGISDEKNINEYMKVLRKTNNTIGAALLEERKRAKQEKKESEKSKNINYCKQMMKKNDEKNSLKKKIRQMRRDATFPLPKSYMNYKKRVGILGKNTIKTDSTTISQNRKLV